MKAIATIGSGSQEGFLELSLPTFRRYACRHGYDLVIGDGDSQSRSPQWAKVLLLRRLLTAYDLVLWLDADTMVLDDTIDIADELPSDCFQGLVHHANGPNTGVWILRREERSCSFLDAVWATELQEDRLGWWDNSAVLKQLGYGLSWPTSKERITEWDGGTFALDERWNRITVWRGDWKTARIHHLASERLAVRKLTMKADAHFLAGHHGRSLFFRTPWLSMRTWRAQAWLHGRHR